MPDGSLKLRGRVRAALGDNIDTDIIYPGRYLNITDREKTAEHLFELVYPGIRAELRPGEFIVAGRNFGCGSRREQAAAPPKFAGARGGFRGAGRNSGCASSREQAAAALKFAGAGAVIAASFARIFFRNAINLGLPAVVAPLASLACKAGDELEIDLLAGEIRNVTGDRVVEAAALDPRAVELIAAGGLIPYLKRKYAA